MITKGLRRLALGLTAAAAMLSAAGSAAAQAYDGDWQGVLVAPSVKLRLVLHVKTENGDTNAMLDIPDQGASLHAGAVKFEDGKINMLFLQAMAELKGALSPDGKILNAHWVQGLEIPVTFTKIEAAPAKP